ncbi:glycosyltransferase family 8 protein [Brachyspira intermedia]|uniref:glycosyltransferase family 8 protein n=1 Tax=Brachyspira intermedia TaxID=84377 RepID=UPI00300491E4
MYKIDICMSSDDNYIPYMCTTICSILKNSYNDDYHIFHIINDGISYDSKNKIDSLKKIKEFEIKYYTPNIKKYNMWFNKLTNKAHFSPAMFFRLDIPYLIDNLDKIIYLDSDTIVNKSLRNLNNIDILNYYLIAARKGYISEQCISDKNKIGLSENHTYFNSGVLVFNIKKWKEDNIDNIINNFMNNQDFLLYGDQHILNAVFKDTTKFISEDYNYLCIKSTTRNQLMNCDDISIFHFCTDQKPWNIYCQNLIYTEKWWEYFFMTPFFNENIGKYIEILVNQKINNILYNDINNLNNKIIKLTDNTENTINKLIDSIAWWIPVKKWRDNFRNKIFNTDQTRPDQTRPDQTRPDHIR